MFRKSYTIFIVEFSPHIFSFINGDPGDLSVNPFFLVRKYGMLFSSRVVYSFLVHILYIDIFMSLLLSI